jgi:RimJ/RimL family protein N-acetyltransferase
MSAPPLTVLEVLAEEAASIRQAVRSADPSGLGTGFVLAAPEQAAMLAAFLKDPAVSEPLYDLPRPFTEDSVRRWIAAASADREAGEGLLAVRLDEAGCVAGFSRFTVWPEHSAAEIAGATRADLQNAGAGKVGAARSFAWMFEVLKVRLLCVTAALDNGRSARVIEAAGFRPMGRRDCVRPDGGVRPSLYWEATREDLAAAALRG